MRACAFLAVAVLLVAALLPTLCPQAAWAEGGAVPQVVGSFDKESYAAGEGATVTFRVTNDGTAAWSGARLEVRLPQGMKLAGEGASTVAERETLPVGETLELRVPVAFEAGFFGTALASTGDGTPGAALALTALAAAILVLLAAGTLSRDRVRARRSRSGMSVLLAAVLVAGLAPALPVKAFGDEGGSPEPTVFLGEAVCSSPAATVTAAFTIRNSNETASPVANVAVADGQAVPASAKYALVEVVSDLPFADGLSSATVRLGDSFEGLQVTSVERTGDNTAVVRVEGGAPSGSDGLIVFDEGSFTDGRAVGGAAVSVEAATLSFDADGSSYGNGAFTLPVSVENGRFACTASAQDWLFRDGAGLAATSFSVDPDDNRRGTLTVRADQAIASDQVAALSAALDPNASQLFLAPAALVGEAGASLAADAIEGRAGTLAEAASAVPYGAVEATGVVRNADGSLTVTSKVTLGAKDGSVHLTDLARQIILPGQEKENGLLENSQVELGSILDDGRGFDFTFDIDADTAASWYGPFKESDQSEAEAEQQFLVEITQLMCGREVDLVGGAVLNAYGIQQGNSAIILSNVSSLDELNGVAVASSSEEDAKKAFEALEKIVSAIGWFSAGGEGAASGISELLGLIAAMIDPSPKITLQDIYDELQQMKGQLSRMETSIDRMAVELQAVDKRAGFDSEWYEVKWRIDHLSSYGGLYTTLASKLDAGSADDDLATVMKANEKLLNQYASAIDKKDKLLGTTVYTDTRSLGTLILGTGQKDIVSDYYNWLETYYNWDPETFVAKDEYLASVMMAYLYGYGASMAYLNVKASQEDPDDPFGEGDNAVYVSSMRELKEQTGQVVKKLAGEVGTDSKGKATIAKKSAYRQATEPLPGDGYATGYVRNLLNNRSYPLGKYMLQDIYADKSPNFYTSVEKDRLYPYTFNGDINLAQFQQMVANLPQVRGLGGTYAEVDSLWKELEALGFNLDGCYGGGSNIEHHPAWLYWHKTPLNMIAVSDATYHKLKDRTAIEHVRSMTLDVFDMKTGQVVRDVMVSHHEEHWSCGASEWQYKHDIYPVCTIVDHPLH